MNDPTTEPRRWVKDPLAILADGAERGIVIEGGRIVALVGAGREPEGPVDSVFDASAHVVLPGLINTHHHFYQNLTRALPAALGKELFPWLKSLYAVWARLDPEALASAVRVALSELMLSGCTTTSDHHYVFPKGLERAIDIEVEVAHALGMRVILTRGSMNLSEKDGGLPPDSVVQDEDAILADSERLAAAYHERGPGAMVQIALAPCSPFTVTKSLMRRTADLAEKLDLRLHTHLAETEDENAFCQEKYSCRPLDYLEDCGWASPRVWVAHGVHFEAGEFARLARAGISVTHCPCSNQYLASGFCPVHGLEQAGVRVRARRRWLSLEQRLEPHPRGACRHAAAEAAIRFVGDRPSRRVALGHGRLGGLHWPAGFGRHRGGRAGRSGAVPARRVALRRRWRSDRGAPRVRRPSRRSRHDRRPMAGRGRPHSRTRPRRPDRHAQPTG